MLRRFRRQVPHDVFVIIIIDTQDVMWEIFKSNETIIDVIDRVESKHKIPMESGRINEEIKITPHNCSRTLKTFQNDLHAVSIKFYTYK